MPPVTPDHFHEIATVTDPRLAPDGEHVVFVRTIPMSDHEYESTIYIVPTTGGTARRYTPRAGTDAEPRWSPSGDRLAFVSTRERAHGRGQLWILPTDGGEPQRVTHGIGTVSEIAWSPDGRSISFVQATTEAERERGLDLDHDDDYQREPPDPRVIDRLVYRSKGGYFDGKRSHVYVVDLAADEVLRLTDGEFDYHNPTWRDTETLYYTVKRTDDPDDNIIHDIVEHDLSRDIAVPVTQTTAWSLSLSISSDGRIAHSYYHEDKATMRPTEIRVYDPETDRTVCPTAGMDRTVGSVTIDEQPHWGHDDEFIYFVSPERGRFVIRRVRSDASEHPEIVARGRHVTEFDVGRERLVFIQAESRHPGDVFSIPLDGSEVRRVTTINASYLEDRDVAEPEEIWFDTEDGHRVQGWVLTPPDFDPRDQYPLLVQVHGGTHHMWTTTGSMWHEFQSFAARGYVVFWCNPRGSTGYGESFSAATERNWGPVSMTDIMAGVDVVATREYVDETNLFVTGGSFGGYITAWIIGQTDRFKASVVQRGVYDKIGDYGGTDFAFKLTEWDYGNPPWADPDIYWEHSPIAHADKVTTPTLILHAEDDYRVPISNGETFYRFLKKNGVATRFVRYPREGHELSRSGEPAHVVDRLVRIGRWFDGYSDHHDAAPVVGEE